MKGDPGDLANERPLAVLVTGHYLRSDRKAGFHWLADALSQMGFSVTMMTTGISWLSVLRRDHRMRYGLRKRQFRSLDQRADMASIVWFTPWHPGNLRSRLMNWLVSSRYRKYGELDLGHTEMQLRTADLLLFDAGPGLMLVERSRAMNPNALLLLRASDDLRAMNQHQVVLEADSHVAGLFDDISVPSAGVSRRYSGVSRTYLDHHGVAKGLFDASAESPYDNGYQAHAVFIGNGFFDYEFLAIAREAAPEICFHIIGPISGLRESRNVVLYGEMPFESTVPYVVHANVGLHTLEAGVHSATFSDSLKTRQYAYCRLPIVAPVSIPLDLPGAVFYQLNESSIRSALSSALELDRSALTPVIIDDWHDLAQRIVHRGLRYREACGASVTPRLSQWAAAARPGP